MTSVTKIIQTHTHTHDIKTTNKHYYLVQNINKNFYFCFQTKHIEKTQEKNKPYLIR